MKTKTHASLWMHGFDYFRRIHVRDVRINNSHNHAQYISI